MSERLTMFTPVGYVECDPVDTIPNGYSLENFRKIVQKLGEYEDLEEAGRLIKLPCRPYDLVWVADEHNVREAKFTSNAAIVKTMKDGAGIGRTAEEAEANFKGAAVLSWPPKGSVSRDEYYKIPDMRDNGAQIRIPIYHKFYRQKKLS